MSVLAAPRPHRVTPRRLEPDRAASGIVEELWVVRSDAALPDRVELPDGRPGVVLSLGVPDVWLDPLSRSADAVGSVLHGVRTVPAVVRRRAPWAVGARLTPWALGALQPGGFLVDDRCPLGEALGVDEADLVRRARACWEYGVADPGARAARLLEEVLVAAVRRPTTPERHADLAGIVRLADDERGLLRPVDLARVVERSLASLHQLFAEEVGLSPAAYLATVRMSAAVRELGVADDADAGRVVATLRAYADAGYAPREVERFTGLSALDLRRTVRGMEEVLATA